MTGGAPVVSRTAPEGSAPPERLVIIGSGETAAVAFDYFRYDSPHQVVAFSAESQFLQSQTYCGLPLISLEKLSDAYPPTEYKAFVAISFTQLNRLRRRLYDAVKAAGFGCVSYVSSHALVMPGAAIGENCFIQEYVALQPNTRIGDNVILSSGTCIGHRSVIEDDCFAGPRVTVCGFTRIGRRSFLGATSCIANALTVGEDCVLSAGAVVLKDAAPRQVYIGNPARPVARDSFQAFGVEDSQAARPEQA
jgi:sugar O-acyltransferase (sialic acid O-acetyltransferase NeuD family)